MWKFWSVGTVLCLLAILPSVIIPLWAGRDIPDYKSQHFRKNTADASILALAVQLERQAQLDKAAIQYEKVRKSQVKELALAAEAGLNRIGRKKHFLVWEEAGWIYEYSKKWQIAALMLAIVALFLSYYTSKLKKGIEIQPFRNIGGEDPQDKVNFGYAFAEQLRAIKYSFEELPEELARVNDNLLPTLPLPSLAGDPLTTAITDLGKVEVKGAVGFSIDLGKFFSQKNRFVLTGSVYPKENPVCAFIWMHDRKTSRVIGIWEAEDHEADIINTTGQPGSLVQLARILACKMFFDNPTSPAGRPPVRSWRTLYHFAESLRFSNRLDHDSADAQALQQAAYSLQIICDKIEDDYSLARFRRGQLLLLTRQPDLAAQQFEAFSLQAEADLQLTAKKILQKRKEMLVARNSWLFKILTKWSRKEIKSDKIWKEITLYQKGGLCHQMIELYRQIPREVTELLEAQEKGDDTATLAESLGTTFRTLSDFADPGLLEKYIIALKKMDSKTAGYLKQELDKTFNLPFKLTYGLDRLYKKVKETDISKGKLAAKAFNLTEIQELREEAPMKILKLLFDRLIKLLGIQEWGKGATELERLWQWTRPVDESEACQVVTALPWSEFSYPLYPPGLGSALKALQEARKKAFSALLLESLYYAAFAELQTFTNDGINKAYDQAYRLLRILEEPNTLGIDHRRRSQLTALALCLMITAAARLKIEKIENVFASLDITFFRYKRVIGKSELELLTSHQDIKIQADAHVASGLLFLVEKEDDQHALDHATLHFESALQIHKNANTYVYLAECNKMNYRQEEAIALIQTALKLYPRHPLAIRRLNEWNK